MKKIISLAICILVLLSCFTIVVSAEDELLENPIEIEMPEGFEPISFFSGGSCFIKKDQEIGLLSTDGAYTSLGQFEFDEAGGMPSLDSIEESFNFGGPFVTLTTHDDDDIALSTEKYLCKDGTVYDYIKQSYSGNYFAETNGSYGVLNKYGKVIVPCMYDYVGRDAAFSEGLLAVAKGQDEEGLWTYLKDDGTLLGDYKYLSAGRFSNGLAPVSYIDEEMEKEIYGFIDKSGTVKFEVEAEYVTPFYNNYAFANFSEYDSEENIIDGKVEIYDAEGNKIAYKGEIKLYNLIDETPNNEIFTFSDLSLYKDIVPLNMVFNIYDDEEIENEYIFFNTKTGEFYDENTYSEVISVNEDMICVQNSDGLYGFVNTEGEEVVPCIYFDAYDFSNGLASVANDEGLYGYIDKTGEVVIPLQYSDAGPFTEGLAPVANEDGMYGAINDKGETVIEFKYDMLSGFYNGLSMFSENDGMGLINKSGEVVVPAEYMIALPFGFDSYPMIMNIPLFIEDFEDELSIYLHSLNFDGSELIDGDYDICLAAGDGMVMCANIEDEEFSIFKIKETEIDDKVSNVKTLINALPETLSDDNLEDINAAVNAFESLNYEQQQILSQNNKLREAQKYLIEKDIDSYLKGDINGDNRVTVSDIVTLRAIIMGDLKPTALQEILCDVDGDNRQTVTDIVNLRSIIMGD